VDLLSRYGQHRQIDPIELVEAAPTAGLSKTLVDSSQAPVIELVGAVEDDNVFAESFPHILHSF